MYDDASSLSAGRQPAPSLRALEENIALLGMIRKKISDPHDNPVPQGQQAEDNTTTRVLHFRREQSIATCLCYLAARTPDPDRVLSLAVEESKDGRGLGVAFAVNSGDIKEVKQGVDRMLMVLEDEACNVKRKQNFQRMMVEVVRWNRPRLLSRLKSRHSWITWRPSAYRPSFILKMLEATEILKQAGDQDSFLAGLRNIVVKLEKEAGKLEDMDTATARSEASDPILLSVLELAHQIQKDYQLGWVLDQIPRCEGWEEEAKARILSDIAKLSRFVEAINELLRSARRIPMFKSIEAHPVRLDPRALEASRRPTSASSGGLARSISKSAKVKDNILLLQLGGLTEVPPEKLVGEVESRCTVRKKVHGEMSLLFHYEQVADRSAWMTPRFICSSKKACYLCDAFIRAHGRFHTPATHGNFYPQWKIPDISKLEGVSKGRRRWISNVVRDFNDGLEAKIRALANAKGTQTFQLQHVNESALLGFAPMTPSVQSKLSALIPTASKRSDGGVISDHGRQESTIDGDSNSTTLFQRSEEPEPESSTLMSPVGFREDSNSFVSAKSHGSTQGDRRSSVAPTTVAPTSTAPAMPRVDSAVSLGTKKTRPSSVHTYSGRSGSSDTKYPRRKYTGSTASSSRASTVRQAPAQSEPAPVTVPSERALSYHAPSDRTPSDLRTVGVALGGSDVSGAQSSHLRGLTSTVQSQMTADTANMLAAAVAKDDSEDGDGMHFDGTDNSGSASDIESELSEATEHTSVTMSTGATTKPSRTTSLQAHLASSMYRQEEGGEDVETATQTTVRVAKPHKYKQVVSTVSGHAWILLQIGQAITFVMDMSTPRVQIRTPKLKLALENADVWGVLAERTRTYTRLLVEARVEAAHQMKPSEAVINATAPWKLKLAREGVLYSPGGLVVHDGNEAVRLRIVSFLE